MQPVAGGHAGVTEGFAESFAERLPAEDARAVVIPSPGDYEKRPTGKNTSWG